MTKWAEIKRKNNVSKSNTYHVMGIRAKEKIRLAYSAVMSLSSVGGYLSRRYTEKFRSKSAFIYYQEKVNYLC